MTEKQRLLYQWTNKRKPVCNGLHSKSPRGRVPSKSKLLTLSQIVSFYPELWLHDEKFTKMTNETDCVRTRFALVNTETKKMLFYFFH